MFWSTNVLTTRGPLGKVWLAAQWDKRCTSSLRFFSFPDDIIKPQQPLALRTSGSLLLGCARIYEFKLAMLFQDCANAAQLPPYLVGQQPYRNDLGEATALKEGGYRPMSDLNAPAGAEANQEPPSNYQHYPAQAKEIDPGSLLSLTHGFTASAHQDQDIVPAD